MIDIENDVYDICAKALRAKFAGIFVTNEYTEHPARFPAVTIVEADNRVVESMRTLTIENAAGLMYQVEVYSNKVGARKSEAKKIAVEVDRVFASLGFTRTFMEQVPNLHDATIYRIVCRYEAVVGPGAEGAYLIYQSE